MDKFPIQSLNPIESFPALSEIPQKPTSLFARGAISIEGHTLIAFVGSRNCTNYGKAVCRALIAGLKGLPIIIVSGLARGIDREAHQAALDMGIKTIAFPGSSLDWKSIYPSEHRELAQEILMHGGALVSEYKENMKGYYWIFPRRNRLIAAISDMTVVIEAEEASGTLITARLATEYNKSVGAVPGSITNASSKGVNWLLKLGAVPITSSQDIIEELNLDCGKISRLKEHIFINTDEQKILDILEHPKKKESIINELSLSPATADIVFSTLEIKGAITERRGVITKLL